MSTQYTIWVHGAGVQVQDEDQVSELRRIGTGCTIRLSSFKNMWVHFIIPTPSVIANAHVRITQVRLEFKSSLGHWISAVYAFHGHYQVATHKGLTLEGARTREAFKVQEKVQVETGLCVSVRVSSGDLYMLTPPYYLHFYGAGATFETV